MLGISWTQFLIRMGSSVTVNLSALITGIRCYLVNFKLHNSKKPPDAYKCVFYGQWVFFAQVFTQVSINPQSSVPACSSLIVNSRKGVWGKVH